MSKNNKRKRNKKLVVKPAKFVAKRSTKTTNKWHMFRKMVVANFFSFIWNMIDGAEKISYIFDLLK
jgi:hypothetical protein